MPHLQCTGGEAAAEVEDGLRSKAATRRSSQHLAATSLATLCRLQLEALALNGDISPRQLYILLCDWHSALPPSLARDLVHSLFAKSLTDRFVLRSLLGRLHLTFPYALLASISFVRLVSRSPLTGLS
jgi:hypothetical protein